MEEIKTMPMVITLTELLAITTLITTIGFLLRIIDKFDYSKTIEKNKNSKN
tara:strand:- start:38 stop:190 length:153 start_codon:yes stop_codon:yes gene_type:complete